MRATAAGFSDVVDVYNGVSGAWSAARLSVARDAFAAASVGNVALFAGGYVQGALSCMMAMYFLLLRVFFFVSACCGIVLSLPLRPLPLSCAPLQPVLRMLLICTTVQQGYGRRLSSAWRVISPQLHLSGTWLCSLGVGLQVRFCAWVDNCFFYCCGVFCVCITAVLRCTSVLFALRPLSLSCTPLQVVLLPTLWMCTT
jgi:hypothetical protein